MSRPEYVTCIRHPHADQRGQTVCGEPVVGFVFEGLDHWYCADLSRLVMCPECYAAVVERRAFEQRVAVEVAVEAGEVVEPHIEAPAWCEACGHVWRAVRPVAMEPGKLECPSCGEMAGKDGEVRWRVPPPRRAGLLWLARLRGRLLGFARGAR